MKKEKIPTHKHVRPAHSLEQERMFFGLAASLGYDKNEVKERAKQRFGKECFNSLSKTQINLLIERLLERQEGISHKTQKEG